MLIRPVANPPNPYLSEHRDWLGPPPEARLEIYEETARSILSENDSPDIPFRWSLNPYRGCQHACAYCYARPTHEFLGMGAGTDFDTKLVAKINAPELLTQAFSKRGWERERVCFSGVTDCYQPIEASYGLTRRCLEVCRQFQNPASVITKGCLILRDLDVLSELNDAVGVRVFLSVPFADDALARRIEPQAPPTSTRLEVVRKLACAGIPVGIMIAPVIPGLNDADIPSLLGRAKEAGASSAAFTAIHLPRNAAPVFLERLRAALPDRAARIESRIREMRGGKLNDANFGARMRGDGHYWHNIEKLFLISAEKCGINALRRPRNASKDLAESVHPTPTGSAVQLPLFPTPRRARNASHPNQLELDFGP